MQNVLNGIRFLRDGTEEQFTVWKRTVNGAPSETIQRNVTEDLVYIEEWRRGKLLFRTDSLQGKVITYELWLKADRFYYGEATVPGEPISIVQAVLTECSNAFGNRVVAQRNVPNVHWPRA